MTARANSGLPAADAPEFSRLPLTTVNPAEVGAVDACYGQIRPAGAEFMRDPPADWDCVDYGSDASFPASDPPCYMTKDDLIE